MKKLKLHIQVNTKLKYFIPKKKKIKNWIKNILKENSEITIRIVNISEIKKINFKYRNCNKPTNILSFEYKDFKKNNYLLLGDLIVCPKIIKQESIIQNKNIESHWAHIIIHGTLHLIGYHHNNKFQKNIMEKIEIKIMKKIGYKNPYFIN